MPAARLVVLVVPAPDPLQAHLSVEVHAARRLDVETAERVTSRCGDVHVDAADGVDNALEADEVDLDVVVDRDVQRLLDRLHQAVGAVAGRVLEGGVDAIGAVGAGDGHVEVARDRQDRRLLLRSVDVQDHHRVGPLPEHLALARLTAGAAGQVVPAVRPDQQHVHDGALVRGQLFELPSLDLAQPPFEVAEPGSGRHHADRDEHARPDEQPPGPAVGVDRRGRLGLRHEPGHRGGRLLDVDPAGRGHGLGNDGCGPIAAPAGGERLERVRDVVVSHVRPRRPRAAVP